MESTLAIGGSHSHTRTVGCVGWDCLGLASPGRFEINRGSIIVVVVVVVVVVDGTVRDGSWMGARNELGPWAVPPRVAASEKEGIGIAWFFFFPRYEQVSTMK